MSWLKTTDGEWCAPWVFIVGPAAYGCYVRLEGYCAQNETDGHVPAELAAMILGAAGKDAAKVREKLLANGRIEPAPIGDGILLPFFLDNNPTRAELEAQRAVRSASGKKAAAARWSGRE